MNQWHKKLTMGNVVYLIACLCIAFWGLYYNSLSNIWLMAFAIIFIIFQSIRVGKIRVDINLLFLAETFFIKAMFDQHIGKADIVPTTMALPMLMYLLGKLLVLDKDSKTEDTLGETIRANIAFSFLTLGTSLLAVLDYRLTRKSPVASMGYYSVAFTNDTFYTNAASYYFNFIFIGCFILSVLVWLFYKLTYNKEKIVKIRPYILLFAALASILTILLKYVKTERYLALKQGVQLITTRHWGNFGGDLTYNNSTSNMWLDYGRDYGILVFITLFIFLIITVKDTVKLACNKNVGIFCKTFLVSSFIAVNTYYFIDSFAYMYPYLWYIGLVINGMISVMAYKDTEVKKERKNND